jgi:APA family basic amino acid/polyamine antiporter
MLYGMAEDGGMPQILHRVHKKYQTPLLAIIVTALIAIAFVLIGKIEVVASLTDFALFMTFILINISLLWLRHKMPATKRPFRTYAPLAALGAITSVAMLFYLNKTAWLIGAVMIASGLLAHELFRRQK